MILAKKHFTKLLVLPLIYFPVLCTTYGSIKVQVMCVTEFSEVKKCAAVDERGAGF